jgi:hypothetical protein
MTPHDESIDTQATLAAISREMAEDTNAHTENLITEVYWKRLAEIASSDLSHEDKMVEQAKLNKRLS